MSHHNDDSTFAHAFSSRPMSVRHWKTRKSNEKKRIRKSKLPGGLPKWSETKRARTNQNRTKDSWSYQKVKHEMAIIEKEKERIRTECCKRTQNEIQVKQEDKLYFNKLLKDNSEEVARFTEESFKIDDRDLGLNGYPIEVDSDDEL